MAALGCGALYLLLALLLDKGHPVLGKLDWPAGLDGAAEPGGDVPTRAELDADAAWVRRRFEVGSSRQPERVRGLTKEKASRYIRSGRPFIVTDMVEDWAMRDWDCESMRRDFGDEEIMPWNAYGGDGEPESVRLSDP